MVTVKQHLFKVWDETGSGADISLNQDDLVKINLRNGWRSGMPQLGRFKGVKEDAGDGQRYVVLEVADRIAGYDVLRLQTKLVQFGVKDIDHVQLLARSSFASNSLFDEIGTLIAKTAELRTRVTKAAEVLDAKRM